MSLWIKICGTTSLADAELAVEAGADAVGFVFAPSPRQVTAAQVAAIVEKLPQAVAKIGVFAEAGVDAIAATIREAQLTGAQLHFDAAPELTARLREQFGNDLRIVRVMRIGREGAPAAEIPIDANADAVLVDSCSKPGGGGTGVAYDWKLAAATFFRDARLLKYIAAGGLNPINVAEAIAVLRPWGVDVASGVESAPGRKDAARLRAFIVNARAADAG
jgi:phosphoribosylanthranilate isomerase